MADPVDLPPGFEAEPISVDVFNFTGGEQTWATPAARPGWNLHVEILGRGARGDACTAQRAVRRQFWRIGPAPASETFETDDPRLGVNAAVRVGGDGGSGGGGWPDGGNGGGSGDGGGFGGGGSTAVFYRSGIPGTSLFDIGGTGGGSGAAAYSWTLHFTGPGYPGGELTVVTHARAVPGGLWLPPYPGPVGYPGSPLDPGDPDFGGSLWPQDYSQGNRTPAAFGAPGTIGVQGNAPTAFGAGDGATADGGDQYAGGASVSGGGGGGGFRWDGGGESASSGAGGGATRSDPDEEVGGDMDAVLFGRVPPFMGLFPYAIDGWVSEYVFAWGGGDDGTFGSADTLLAGDDTEAHGQVTIGAWWIRPIGSGFKVGAIGFAHVG